MLFSKLMPKEGNFFELFNRHAEHVVEAAQAFGRLVEHYGDAAMRQQHTREVDGAERAADRVTHEVTRLVHTTFITPIDREQIHALINQMDDVADLLQDCAEAMTLYDVQHMTPEVAQFTALCLQCCERVRDAVGGALGPVHLAGVLLAHRRIAVVLHKPAKRLGRLDHVLSVPVEQFKKIALLGHQFAEQHEVNLVALGGA